MKIEVTPESALRVIRTWAAVQLEYPTRNILSPESVIAICDEALGKPNIESSKREKE